MNVLLVDDHAPFRDGAALLIRSIVVDVHVVEASNAGQALATIAERNNLGLAFIDLNLPDAPRGRLISLVRNESPQLPIVALSSNDDAATIVAAVEAGAMGFISKHAPASAFADAVRHVMAKGIYLPRAFTSGDPRAPREPAGGISPGDLGLTPPQAHVLYCVLQGQPVRTIAHDLSMSSGTVKAHTNAALKALKATTRTQAIVAAAKLGLSFQPRSDDSSSC